MCIETSRQRDIIEEKRGSVHERRPGRGILERTSAVNYYDTLSPLRERVVRGF